MIPPETAVAGRAMASSAAPLAPHWLLSGVGAFLADPRADTDALLLLADALDHAAAEAMLFDKLGLAADLRALAALPRGLVPGHNQGRNPC